MNVAITGANGYVGQYLCNYLSAQNLSIVAITRRAHRKTEIENVENRVIPDYSNTELATQQLRNCDCVIHLAGLAHAAKAQTDDYYRINVEHSLSIAKAAANAGIKRFIYLSSIKVNGEITNSIPFQHTDTPQPQDDYGRSKLKAEQSLQTFCAEKSIELIIIRPPLIWGENNKGNLATLEKALRYHLPLPLANINNRRDLVSLENLSSLTYECLTNSQIKNEILLVSDGAAISTTQLIQLLGQITKQHVSLFSLPKPFRKLLKSSPITQNLYNRIFANLEVNISHTLQVTNWRPSNHPHTNTRLK